MYENLTYWQLIDLAGPGIALFVAATLLCKPLGHRKANHLLALYFFCAFIKLTAEHDTVFPHLRFVDLSLAFLLPPLIWMYLIHITSSAEIHFTRFDLLRLLPFLLATLLLIPAFILDGETKQNLVGYCSHADSNCYNTLQWLRSIVRPVQYADAIHTGLYLFFIFRLLLRHRTKIKQEFSYTENITLNWLFYLLSLEVIGWLVILSKGYFPKGSEYQFITNHFLILLTFIFIFFAGIFVLTQRRIYPDQKESVTDNYPNKEKYANSPLDREMSNSILTDVMRVMSHKKLYLNNMLTLSHLAAEIEVSPRHVSQVINENTGKNFFDFVNTYRIEEAKQYLSDVSSKKTILEIAMAVGFNSKSAFYDAFKRQVETTPSQFRNRMVNE